LIVYTLGLRQKFTLKHRSDLESN